MLRAKLKYIKVLLLLALVVFLYAFSSIKNAERKVGEPTIKFIGEDNLFVTHETVSKLLIQNQQSVTNKPKEIIDLNELESALNSNPMIKEAQVFMSVDGTLTAEIKQKKPIARVSSIQIGLNDRIAFVNKLFRKSATHYRKCFKK